MAQTPPESDHDPGIGGLHTFAAAFFWGGILVFVVTVFIFAGLQRRELERGRKPMWPIVVMAAGVAVFGIGAAGYFWPASRSEGHLAENESSPEKSAQVSTGELLLECQQAALPTVGLPKQNSLTVVNPFRFDKEGTIGISGLVTEPGQPIALPEEWKNKTASSARCRLTNYGKNTLFNVEVPIRITFKRIKRGDAPGNAIAEEIINVAEIQLPITKIEPGSDATYTFYIHNQGRDVVEPHFPDNANHLPPGAGTRRPLTLIQSTSVAYRYVALWPVRSVEDIIAEDEKAKTAK